MAVRLAGLTMTVLAVLVLLGSMLAGLGAQRAAAPPTLSAPATIVADPADPIGVEVLNGSGIAGAARAATERLRGQRFDVKYYGNAAGAERDTSVVLDRRGDPAIAGRVADALGIGRVEIAIDTTLYLDATVILGRDWGDAR